MTDTTGFSLRGLLADTTPVIWLITAAWTLLLCLWSVLPPIFSAPDEPQHIDTIIDTVGRSPLMWVTPDGDRMSNAILEAQDRFGYRTRDPQNPDLFLDDRRLGGRTAEEAFPRDERPSVAALSAADRLPSSRLNQMYQHPPLYYRTAAWVIGTIPGWERMGLDVLVGIMRLLSVVVVAPLPIVMAGLARVLDGRRSLELPAALSPLLVPQLAHLGSVTSNDGLLFVLTAFLVLLLARVYRGDTSRSTATWVGTVLLAAMLTKGFALFMPVAVVAAYGGAVRVSGVEPRAAMARLLRSAAIAGLSLWWYGENLLRFGGVQPSVAAPPAADEHGSVLRWLGRAWITQTQTFWGRFGWAETGFGEVTTTTLSIVAIVLVLIAVRKREGTLLTVLLLPGVLAIATTIGQSWASWDTIGTIRAVHGRYFFVSLAGLLLLVVMGLHRLVDHWPSLARWTWVPVFVTGVWLHASSWLTAVDYFWTTAAAPSLADGGRALLAWQPWPPLLVQVTAVALALLGVELLRRLVAFSRADGTTTAHLSEEQHESEDEEDHVPA